MGMDSSLNPAAPGGRKLAPVPGCLLKAFLFTGKTILNGIAGVVVLYWFFMLLGNGIYYCDTTTEYVTLKWIALFGGDRSAWEITRRISEMSPVDCCSSREQRLAIESICGRRPANRDKIVAFSIDEILKEDKPHFNRVHLIGLVEDLTGESLAASGYPMTGWADDQIPEMEKPNIERGLIYIRRWWENKNGAEKSSYPDKYQTPSFSFRSAETTTLSCICSQAVRM